LFKRINGIICALVILCTFFIYPQNKIWSFEGEVKVGKGSYSTVLPPGAENAQSLIYKTDN